MENLEAYGIEFDLDDYGTGYSNTSRLEEFGGNLIQGFYYATPLSLNEFVDFINKSNC